MARTISLPYPSLGAAYTNTGVSDDSQPAAGNLNDNGYSLSAQALAIAPGATVSHGGLDFTWPAGAPDNVVAAGQTIELGGSGTKLGLIGTAVNATASGPATITYTDGTTQTYPLSFADWYADKAAGGGEILTTVAYHNSPTGQVNHQVSLYYTAVALDPVKTVRYLTLPTISQSTEGAQIKMHIFSASIG